MGKHDHAGLWKKGQSGNPGGRAPIIRDVQELARKHTTAAIAALVHNLTDESGQVRNVAAVALLDRAYGRPHQSSDVTVRRTDVRQWTTAELDAAIIDAIARETAPDGNPDLIGELGGGMRLLASGAPQTIDCEAGESGEG